MRNKAMRRLNCGGLIFFTFDATWRKKEQPAREFWCMVHNQTGNSQAVRYIITHGLHPGSGVELNLVEVAKADFSRGNELLQPPTAKAGSLSRKRKVLDTLRVVSA